VRESGGRRRAAERVRAVDAHVVRGDVVARFRAMHPEVDDDAALSLVSQALRRWFRLLAADPGAQLALPSEAVASLWLETVRDEEPYALLCAQAFGRVLAFTPLGVPVDGALPDAARLARTLDRARADDDAPIPLLFGVDEAVGIVGGRRYLAACGGGTQCHPVHGRWCLEHLTGASGRPPAGRRHRPLDRTTNEIPNSQVRTWPFG